MNLIKLLTVIGIVSIGRSSASGLHKQMLEELCTLKQSGLKVTRISDVKALIDVLIVDDTVKCPREVQEAIFQLLPVVELDNVCSEEAANTMVRFWSGYVQDSSPVKQNLPGALRDFFLAFGNQVSKVCKATMIARLERASHEQGVSELDVNLAAASVRGYIDAFFDDTRVENLAAIIKADKGVGKGGKKKIDMEPKQKRFFELMQEKCIKKLKPIYDTLVVPVVKLASIGMSYRNRSLADSSISDFEQSAFFRNWFAAILMCEASLKFTAVNIAQVKEDDESDQHMITFLDDEDVEELVERTGLDPNAIRGLLVEEPVDYRVHVSIDDLVVDESDAALMESVRMHRVSVAELDRFRWNVARRLPSLMKSHVGSKAVKFGLLSIDAKRKELKKATSGGSIAGRVLTWVGILLGVGLAVGIFFGLLPPLVIAITFAIVLCDLIVAGFIVVVYLIAAASVILTES